MRRNVCAERRRTVPGVGLNAVRPGIAIGQVLALLGFQPAISDSKNLFRCFNSTCNAQGNVLDLWAAIHKLPLYKAALHLAAAFGLARNREEEPVRRNPSSREKATTNTASVNND
jgi:hypothetical protein